MTDQQPAKPTGLRVVAALVFVVGLWSLFMPNEYSSTLGNAPQLVGVFIAGCCLVYAFSEK